MLHTRSSILAHALLLCLIFSFAACKADIDSEPAYHLAQGCYAIQAVSHGRFLVAQNQSTYRFAELASETPPATFFLKPSALGRFLLYDNDGGYFARERHTVKRLWQASNLAEWEIHQVRADAHAEFFGEAYTLAPPQNEHVLWTSNDQPSLRISTGNEPEPDMFFKFVPYPADDCQRFTEASLNAEVLTPLVDTSDDSGTVYGFVDFHAHLAFPKALGSMAMPGGTFHPFGIEHALGDCSELHGAGGQLDFLESQNTSSGNGGHQTSGYPDFHYWPNRTTNTHVQAYYRWIERAYLSGLRIIVTNLTSNPTFCQLLGMMHPGKQEGDCKSDSDISLQVKNIYDLQDYIDAQEGGPGKGWFRIATSPEQARQIVSQGKLAVILGAEHGTLFDCALNAKSCDQAHIDQKLDELYELGIRSVFPIHRFDNAFGGARPQSGAAGAWMHLTSKISSSKVDHLLDLLNPAKLLFKPIGGQYWDLDVCPADVQGTSAIKSMKRFMEEDFSFLRDTIKQVPVAGGLLARLLNWTFIDKLQPLPEYQRFSDGQPVCNTRPLQDLGAYLLHRLMDKGMIIEIDHMSYKTMLETLDTLESRQYSGVVSSHSWFENRPEVRERIHNLGGLIAPMNGSPAGIAQTLESYANDMQKFDYWVGVGIGTDIQGVTSQASADPGVTISYPFTSYDGKVQFFEPVTGHRRFDYQKEGMAHYGLLPEWVENLRQVDQRSGSQATAILMQSSEAYLQMWERANNTRH